MTAPSVARARRRSRPLRTHPFRILVASSAEPSSLGAIRLATLIARRRSASVHALIAATPFPHTMPSVFAVAPPALVDDDNRRGALDQLRRQLATVRGTREWAVRATTGFAADSISETAARWPASLVVMGAGEHGPIGRFLGSGTAVKVASHATVPVLAVPAGAQELPVRAVAAVDFTPSSIAAAVMAATLLGPGGTLTLLYASPLIVEGGPPGALTDLYTTGARDRLLETAEDVRRRSKRAVVTQVATGSIVDRLREFVEDNGCDLIAMGAHEPSLLERVLVGSVRGRVLSHASCSVLVVPLAKDEPA
jgi:nucleotide-binding universal stress UspA family protein